MRPGASGTFMMLPMGMRIIDKLIGLIEEEMNVVGAEKLSMPVLHQKELWTKTGRWDSTGSELWRLKDRKGREFCLAPTHEEMFTKLIADSVRSDVELPISLYQIGPKYRDEARPRFGLLRGREFWMKDAYSFHSTEEDAIAYYHEMEQAYRRLFARLGRQTLQVEADSGGIGGSLTHEFQMLAQDVGEDVVLVCPNCEYAANEEQADSVRSVNDDRSRSPIATHAVVVDDVRVGSLLCASDREPNLVRLRAALGSAADVETRTPIDDDDDDDGLERWPLLVDDDVWADAQSDVEAFQAPLRGSFTLARAGDQCGRCESAPLETRRSIEVGQIFYLGEKYSSVFGATTGREDEGTLAPMFMGCYGIGISRILAALVESSPDAGRPAWPAVVAPYVATIVTAGGKSADRFRDVATELSQDAEKYRTLAGEVVLDDRWDAGLGMKLTESELIGYPFTVIVGKTFEKEGRVEIRDALTGETSAMEPRDAFEYVNREYERRISVGA